MYTDDETDTIVTLIEKGEKLKKDDKIHTRLYRLI